MSMIRIPWSLAVCVCALLLLCQSAFAHKVNIFAAWDGDKISGRVYFSGGGKADSMEVKVSSADGTAIESLKTDSKGAFSYIPKSSDGICFSADTGDGHLARIIVKAKDVPAKASGATMEPLAPISATKEPGQAFTSTEAGLRDVVSDEVSKQLLPLREQLDAYGDAVRLHDIIGGIGYIFGVAGLAALFLSRRPRKG